MMDETALGRFARNVLGALKVLAFFVAVVASIVLTVGGLASLNIWASLSGLALALAWLIPLMYFLDS